MFKKNDEINILKDYLQKNKLDLHNSIKIAEINNSDIVEITREQADFIDEMFSNNLLMLDKI